MGERGREPEGQKEVTAGPIRIGEEKGQEFSSPGFLVLDLPGPAVIAGTPQNPPVIDLEEVLPQDQLLQPMVPVSGIHQRLGRNALENGTDVELQGGQTAGLRGKLTVLDSSPTILAGGALGREHGPVLAIPPDSGVRPPVRAFHGLDDLANLLGLGRSEGRWKDLARGRIRYQENPGKECQKREACGHDPARKRV
jgi:hypothetical protein